MARYFSKINSGCKDCCSVHKPSDDPFSFIYGQAGICQVRGPPVSWLEQDIEKKLEDERMEKKQTDSVQNRFTAYLMVAVANRRVSYMEQRNRQKEWEYIQVDLLEKNHVDFDAQYRTYMAEQSLLRYLGYGESSECMPEIDSIQLAKCINRLKDRERRILFAREEIFRMYRPLLIKNAMDKNVFDEDLYQELSATLLNCIQKFRI